MKKAYTTPKITELGSVSKVTKSNSGSYGEFVLPGQTADGMMMSMMMMNQPV